MSQRILSQDPCWSLPESKVDQPMQSGHYHISEQESQIQRVRNQVEMDAQIAHRLQRKEQVKEQYQRFQTAKQADIDGIRYQAQALIRQNR